MARRMVLERTFPGVLRREWIPRASSQPAGPRRKPKCLASVAHLDGGLCRRCRVGCRGPSEPTGSDRPFHGWIRRAALSAVIRRPRRGIDGVPPVGSFKYVMRQFKRHPWHGMQMSVTGKSLRHVGGTPPLARENFFSAQTPEDRVVHYAARLEEERTAKWSFDQLILSRPKPERVTTPMLVLGRGIRRLDYPGGSPRDGAGIPHGRRILSRHGTRHDAGARVGGRRRPDPHVARHAWSLERLSVEALLGGDLGYGLARQLGTCFTGLPIGRRAAIA